MEDYAMELLVSVFLLGAAALLTIHAMRSAPKARPIPIRKDDRRPRG
ncbi:MAG: hypothetical protein ACJA06_000686 [Halocynthiibacter sp.]